MEIQEQIDLIISESVFLINEVIERSVPKDLSNLAQDIFDSKGGTHGRMWESNAVSTKKRKGFDHRNVETGALEAALTTDGFLMDDNYMDELAQINEGYLYANALAPFDDIGRTKDDVSWLREQIIKDIKSVYS
jgi:hypothetical protein